MTRRREPFIAAACCLALSCSRSTPPSGSLARPFELGQIASFKASDPRARQAPTPPTISVVEPATGVTVKPGGKVPCTVRLVLPDGAKMPVFMEVDLTDRAGVMYGSSPLEPKGRDHDGSYLFAGDLRAPKDRASYSLFAKAISINREDADEPDKPFVDRPFYTESPAVAIRVR